MVMRALRVLVLVLVGCVDQPTFVGKGSPIECSNTTDPTNNTATFDETCTGMMFGDHCYVYDYLAYTPWQPAVDACAMAGGYLVTTGSSAEDSFVVSLIGGNQTWLGARQMGGMTTWANSEPVSFTRWLSGGDGCAQEDPAGWGPTDCGAGYRSHVCETPGWTKFQGHSYRHFFEPVTWMMAKARCQALGAHLATILSECEGDFVRELAPYASEFWLGAERMPAFTWVADGELWEYEAFAAGEGQARDEECLAVDGVTGKWNDVACSAARGYVCERDPD
ncbi:MAG TPA: C-type lectin domain-containing protein [Kofleriaceae bacterium]|nr:C-type lectin domain-containing protein [Kofleriaceae bacterium]